ncbi:MAG: apolipoprotein N-acyltransferase [Candidatus Rokubacteria bacterium]|nr:apolipoprotein N-acyltransferase [Candidatus Rokubacteria bacterium]
MFWTVTLAWPTPWVVHYGGVTWARAGLTLVVVATIVSGFTALFCALLSTARHRSGFAWVLIAASLWVALELVRSRVLSGFPWNLLGASQYRHVALIQVAAVTGVYGVSFVVAAVNAALARVLCARPDRRDSLGAATAGGIAVTLAVMVGWLAPARAPGTTAIPVAVVQGNIDQGAKWDAAYVDRTLAIHRALTTDAVRNGARLVVWPETTVPLTDRGDARWREIEALARDAGIYLLVGAPHGIGGTTRNSAYLFGPAGELGRYDKRRLVPFGEYSPLDGWLGFLSVFAGGPISEFSAGTDPVVLATPLGRLAPSICYEAIFPADVRDFVAAGADVLINITNDAWFGPTPTPYQHLALTTFRAVEHRAWLVRAANTGVSAFVAPDGRIVRASPLFARGVLMGAITPRAQTTFYSRYGDVFAWSAVAFAAGVLCPLPSRLRHREAAEAVIT